MGENQLFKKPNQTILITGKEITATQRKAYNAILYKASNMLKQDKTLNLFEFNIAELKDLAGIKGTDNWHTKRDLTNLMETKVDIVRDKNNWDMFNLIAWVGREENKIVIQLPEPVRRELLECNFYTTLDQLIIKTLTGKYAIILYEIAIRYNKTQIPEMTIEELKILTGTNDKSSYNDFYNIKSKIIKPAIDEINSKTDIKLNYITKKQGNKYISVKFNIEIKKNKTIKNLCNKENTNLKLLSESFKAVAGFEIQLQELKNLINDYGEEEVKKYIDNYSKFSFSSDINTSFKLNSFKKAIKVKWPIPVFKSKKPQNMDFEQRTYTDDEYSKFYSNNKGQQG